MKRIVKRYIFDVQRENDANDGECTTTDFSVSIIALDKRWIQYI